MSTMSSLNISISIRKKLMLMLMSRLSSLAHKLLMLMFMLMLVSLVRTGLKGGLHITWVSMNVSCFAYKSIGLHQSRFTYMI